MPELHDAVISGNLKKVRKLLKKDPSVVNDWDLNYNTPLHLIYNHVDAENPTIADNRLPIMQTLLNHGAYVNAVNMDDETPLHVAVGKSQFNGVKMLLEKGANPNIRRNPSLKPPLHLAVELTNNSLDFIKLLLNFNANINACDEFQTALELAITLGMFDIAMFLLNAGGKVLDAYVLLLNTINDENEESLDFIIEHGVKMDLHGRFMLENVLFFLKYGLHCFKDSNLFEVQLKISQLIINKGIIVHSVFEKEIILDLHYAAEILNESKIKLSLEDGVDVNMKDKFGNTLLHSLLSNPTDKKDKMNTIYEISKLLIDKGADVSVKNCFGCRPFHLAIKNSHVKVINLILSKLTGIDIVELRSDKNIFQFLEFFIDYENSFLSELYVATIAGYKEIVDRLKSLNVDFYTHKDVCESPKFHLYFAICENQVDIAKIFIEAKYDNCIYSSVIEWTKLKEMDLKIVCLLWELENRSFLKNLFFETINLSVEDSDYDSNPYGRKYLEILYYAIYSRTNRLDKDLIPVQGIFKLNEGLSTILKQCNKKLDELKREKVCLNFNKYDFISMKLEALAFCLENPVFFSACENLSYYLNLKKTLEHHELILMERITLAMERKKCFDSASDILNESFLSF